MKITEGTRMIEKELIEANAKTYMIVGDPEKPFHLPECECERCEAWRVRRGRPTHEELRKRGLVT